MHPCLRSWIGVLLITLASCTNEPRIHPKPLITIKEVGPHEGIRYPAIICVYPDGEYLAKWIDPTSKSRRYQKLRGTLKSQLIAGLHKLLNGAPVKYEDGSPIYEFYPENSYTTPPAVILDVFQAVLPDPLR